MSPFEQQKTAGEPMRPRSHRCRPKEEGYSWAGENITFPEACKHFITVGSTGSGKSITLNLLMQSVLLKVGKRDAKRRVLVYDAKSDLVSFLDGIAPHVTRHILNPLDKRFVPWDIAADVKTETDAYEFATLLIPKHEGESNPYFNDAARSLITGVIKRFIATAEPRTKDSVPDWTFRDLVLAFESRKRLEHVLTHDETRHLLDHFDKDNDKNIAGVKSTVDNTMALYRPIAALFANAKEKPLSLKTWAEEEESIIVLGNHESAREATDTLNRLILHQLSKFIISKKGVVKDDETWIFLDELREAGRLSGLRQLLLRGRSKGVAVAMGFQDVEGIYAAYGDHEGAEIIGAAQNAVILHINPTAPETAEWASKVFSSRRVKIATDTLTQGGHGLSRTEGERYELVPNVHPIEFVELPMPTSGKHLLYYGFTNTGRYGAGHYLWKDLADAGIVDKKYDQEPDFMLQDDAQKFSLKLWTPEDERRVLGPSKKSPSTEIPENSNTVSELLRKVTRVGKGPR